MWWGWGHFRNRFLVSYTEIMKTFSFVNLINANVNNKSEVRPAHPYMHSMNHTAKYYFGNFSNVASSLFQCEK